MHSKKEKYNAAIYLRISRDDGDKAESDSIQNQREMLKAFVEKDSYIELKKEFVDDGYSGTNFERPGFSQMMRMADSGEIDCIIVKDLSRLGRNYIETGRYIDQIFPMAGVRFISVNDNYDSIRDHNDSDQIVIPFKNLINDAYCRDLSMKVRSQLDIKRKNGKFIGSWAGYGYKKDPEDKTHLIIDDDAADIVRLIFNMKLEGYNTNRIADHLNEMGVLTPLQYKRSLGLNCNVGYWKGENPHWVPPMIGRILKNELYIGNMAQGKFRKVNYKVKKNVPVDESDWIRVDGTHEPIISKAVFDRVQKICAQDTKTPVDDEKVPALAGMVKCAYCGQNMVRRTSVKRRRDGTQKKYVYYTCSTAKAGENCSHRLINADKLEEIVLSAVQIQCRLLLEIEKLSDTMDTLPLTTHQVRLLDGQIRAQDNEIDRYREMKEKLYEDYRDGIIDADDYEDLKLRFTARIDKARSIRRGLENRKSELTSTEFIPSDWMKEITKLGEITELDRKTAVMLIDEVLVYSKERIEVTFCYGDELRAAAETMGVKVFS